MTNKEKSEVVGWLVGWLGFFMAYSTIAGYLMPNPLLNK